MSNTDQPTRMVFTDAIEAGMTLVEQCLLLCPGVEGVHSHQLTVMDRREANGHVTAIVMDERGEQRAWGQNGHEPVRILVTVPAGESVADA